MRVSDKMYRSTDAWRAHMALKGISRPTKRSQSALPRWAYTNRHGWPLNEEGAQRAASRMVKRSASSSFEASNARGDQRSRNRGSIGKFAARGELLVIRDL